MLEDLISAIEDKLSFCRKGEGILQKVGEDVQRGVFLEEKMVESMCHSEGQEPRSPIGEFEFPWSDLQCRADVGPSKRCVKEVSLHQVLELTDQHGTVLGPGCEDLGCRFSLSSRPSCPPGFELSTGANGPANRA